MHCSIIINAKIRLNDRDLPCRKAGTCAEGSKAMVRATSAAMMKRCRSAKMVKGGYWSARGLFHRGVHQALSLGFKVNTFSFLEVVTGMCKCVEQVLNTTRCHSVAKHTATKDKKRTLSQQVGEKTGRCLQKLFVNSSVAWMLDVHQASPPVGWSMRMPTSPNQF